MVHEFLPLLCKTTLLCKNICHASSYFQKIILSLSKIDLYIKMGRSHVLVTPSSMAHTFNGFILKRKINHRSNDPIHLVGAMIT